MDLLARIRDGVYLGDLQHLGRTESIATYLIETSDGLAIVDPGPASCREALQELVVAAAGDLREVRHVLLTHIHLDHAGITGTLARANPRLTVWVHARGAAHLVDPSRLLASAQRLYGDDMARLWGEFLPVDPGQLRVLEGGEDVSLGNRRYRVAYTPGHAIHHVSFLDEHEGLAWVGDVAGEASQHGTPALPAAPPPDIDLAMWRESLDLVAAWRPELLLLTHFGPVSAPAAHLTELWARVLEWSELVRESLDSTESDETLSAAFAQSERERLTSGLPEDRARHVDLASIKASWYGLARFWRKKREETAVMQGQDA